MAIHTPQDTAAMLDTNDFATECEIIATGCVLVGEFRHDYVETYEVQGRRPVLLIAVADIAAKSIARDTELKINGLNYAVRDIDESLHTAILILELITNA